MVVVVDVEAVIDGVDWASFVSPPWYDLVKVRTALAGVTLGQAESDVAWAAAALEDAVYHSHSQSLSPAAVPAVNVLLAVASRWRAEAREQALVSLFGLLNGEGVRPWDTYTQDGTTTAVETAVRGRIRAAVPLLRSLAAEPQPWGHNRQLALRLIDEAG